MSKDRNQRYVKLDAGFWAVFSNLSSAFVVPFALVLGATNFLIGLLTALPYVSVIIAEIPGAHAITYFKNRKLTFVVFGFLSRFLWVFIAFIPFIFKKNVLFYFMLFAFISWILTYLTDPAWTSLVADVIPEDARGKFFGTRNIIIYVVGTIAFLLGGFYLDLFPKNDLSGFSTMFLISVIFGMASIYFVNKIKEPKMRHNHNHFREFFGIKKDFKRFYYYTLFFNFAYNLASPFFTVYMLVNLQLSYSNLVILTAASTLARVLTQAHWGKLSDVFGDRPIAIISTAGTALVPLAFMFITPATKWLLIPAELLSGFVWSGVDLSTFNLLLDLTDHEKRAAQAAGYNVVTSIPLMLSPIVGGLFADKANLILAGIPLVFAMSFVLRALSALFLVKLKEPRVKSSRAPLTHVFKEALTIHSVRGVQTGIKVIFKKITDHKMEIEE